MHNNSTYNYYYETVLRTSNDDIIYPGCLYLYEFKNSEKFIKICSKFIKICSKYIKICPYNGLIQ